MHDHRGLASECRLAPGAEVGVGSRNTPNPTIAVVTGVRECQSRQGACRTLLSRARFIENPIHHLACLSRGVLGVWRHRVGAPCTVATFHNLFRQFFARAIFSAVPGTYLGIGWTARCFTCHVAAKAGASAHQRQAGVPGFRFAHATRKINSTPDNFVGGNCRLAGGTIFIVGCLGFQKQWLGPVEERSAYRRLDLHHGQGVAHLHGCLSGSHRTMRIGHGDRVQMTARCTNPHLAGWALPGDHHTSSIAPFIFQSVAVGIGTSRSIEFHN